MVMNVSIYLVTIPMEPSGVTWVLDIEFEHAIDKECDLVSV